MPTCSRNGCRKTRQSYCQGMCQRCFSTHAVRSSPRYQPSRVTRQPYPQSNAGLVVTSSVKFESYRTELLSYIPDEISERKARWISPLPDNLLPRIHELSRAILDSLCDAIPRASALQVIRSAVPYLIVLMFL